MFKTIQLILMAVLCLFFRVDAQTIPKLSGRITTGIDGKPLPGASIKIKATNYSTQTDHNGQFSVNTPATTGILIISYTGYITEEISFNISKSVVINTELKEKQGDLEEVVVIGYGQTTKRLSTGSISTVTAKEIENQPVTNVLSALSGRMPGVFVQTTNGLPGGNINIQIRGKGSISAGTNPLYIVDGVPYDGNPPVAANQPLPGNSIVGTISPLNNLNPADIESITVLKDADATSIYGSRGSNGVVLITTKKAKAGATNLSVDFQQGTSNLAQKPKIQNLDEYLELRREAFRNDNIIPSSDPVSPNYAPDLTIWSQKDATDWVGYIFGNTAASTDVQTRLSGGRGNTTFSVSGNYHHENTVLLGLSSYQRASLHSQFLHRSDDNKLTVSASNQLSNQFNRLSNVINGISTSFLQSPNYPLYLPDGLPNWYSGNVEAEKKAKDISKTTNSITNLTVDYSVLPTLNFKISAGYTKTSYGQSLIFPTSALLPGTINYSQFGNNNTQTFIVEPQGNYSLKIRQSTLSFLIGATLQSRISDGLYIKASNLSIIKDGLPFISHGKLRLSYGTTGNDQITDYGYTSTYGSPGTNVYQDVASMRPIRISNANFHWETTRKKDLALELGLLKDRIVLAINYYINQSRDQLVQYTIPQITGFSGYQANLPAIVENKGWEFEGSAKITDKSAFKWYSTFNLTIPRNQLKSFERFETSTYKDIYQLGYDITRIVGYQFLSIDQASGNAQYAGQDGEVSLTPYFRFTLGKQTPDYYGGFGNTFSYRNFEFNAFAQFVKQISKGSLQGVPGGRRNNFAYVKDRWTTSNPNAEIPKATSQLTDFYITNSSLNLFNTSYLRLKNVALAYTIHDKKMKIGALKLFLEGQNLLTFWNKNVAVLDPESGARSTAAARSFPTLKTFVFGFHLIL